MSMVEEALNKAKEIKVRVLTTLDAFRPKILIKKPLTELSPLKGEVLEGQGVGTIISKIQNRIESIRRGIGIFGDSESGIVTGEITPMVKSQVTEVKKKGNRVAIHY